MSLKTLSPSSSAPGTHAEADAPLMHVGQIQVDPSGYDVWVDGEPVRLTLMQFNLLRVMARRPGWVHSPQQLAESLRTQPGSDRSAVSPGALKNHIYNLRQRLGKAGSQIQTVRSIGYTLRDGQRGAS